MIKALDSRIDLIKSELEKAAKLRREAEELLRKAEGEMLRLGALKEKVLSEAERAAREAVAVHEKETEITLNRLGNHAEAAIEMQKRNAVLKMEKEFIRDAAKLALDYFEQNRGKFGSDLDIAKTFLTESEKGDNIYP